MKDKLFSWGLYLTCFSLPLLVPNWHGKVIVLLAITWLITVNWKTIGIRLRERTIFLLTLAFIALFLIGLLYSENIDFGLKMIESLIPIVLLPLIIFTSDITRNITVVRNALVAFVMGVITLNLASLFFISRDLWDPVALHATLVLANEHIVQIHPAFLSLYMALSMFFLFDYFFPFQTSDRSKVGWLLFSVAILAVYMIWLNSRAGIFCFLCAAIFFMIYRYNGRARWTGFAFLALIVILIFVLPFSKKRFVEAPLLVASQETTQSTDRDVYPLLNRISIFQTSVDLIKGKEAIYGYGTGDGRDVIHQGFIDRGLNNLAGENLDSHNEYLAEIHRHGVIGLAVLLAMIVYMFRYAIRKHAALLAAFTVLCATTALFENILSAQKGATFLGLLTPLLFLYADLHRDTTDRKPAI